MKRICVVSFNMSTQISCCVEYEQCPAIEMNYCLKENQHNSLVGAIELK